MAGEKIQHLSCRLPIELAVINENIADTCSMVIVDACNCTTPDYFAGKKIIVKKYHEKIA